MNDAKKTSVKGYKAFNPNFKCRDYQFTENSEHKIDRKPELCAHGFHFCQKASHIFGYYDFNPENIVCEIEAIGEVLHHDDNTKSCTNHILIGRRLTWEEVLKVANEGVNNTGHSNTGNRNTGDWNTGNSNTGDRNTGDRNTGYSNTGDRNTGLFCVKDAPFPIFDKASDWTEEQFKASKVYSLLCQVDTKMWVYPSSMTEEEKTAHPSYKTCDGYLKDIPFKEAFQNCWHNWSEENRGEFIKLPNFNKKSFFHITGVKLK